MLTIKERAAGMKIKVLLADINKLLEILTNNSVLKWNHAK